MSEKTTLTEAFREFIDDLKNIEPITVKEFTHDTIKDEFEKIKDDDLSSLQVFDIPVGEIYSRAGSNSKRAIFKHLELLTKLSKSEKEVLKQDADQLMNMLPVSNVLNTENLNRISDLVSQHKQSTDSVIDVLRKVVNSQEFEKITSELTKGYKL
jgi:hypothetical protein